VGKTLFAVDVDGVACDHAAAVCKYVAEKYGVQCKREDVTSWDHNFGAVTFVKAVEEAYPNKDFLLAMEVTPGFEPFLARLRRHLDITFVSTRKPYCREATTEWIRKRFGKCPLLLAENKSQTEAKLLLDDNPDELFRFAQGERIGFLLKQPWNQQTEVIGRIRSHPNLHFARDFGQVVGQLEELGLLPK